VRGAVVRFGDRVDDREPEPDATGVVPAVAGVAKPVDAKLGRP